MKLCSIPPLNSPLALPSSVAVILSPSAIVVVIVLVVTARAEPLVAVVVLLVVHPVPCCWCYWWAESWTFASRRWAGIVAAARAALAE